MVFAWRPCVVALNAGAGVVVFLGVFALLMMAAGTIVACADEIKRTVTLGRVKENSPAPRGSGNIVDGNKEDQRRNF